MSARISPIRTALAVQPAVLPGMLLLALALLATACEPGPGGRASITGLVVAQEFDIFGDPVREYPAADARVYLVYGSDSVIGDEVRAHYSGRYRFDFLRKGLYTVYAYSDCGTCPGGEEAVTVELEVEGGKTVVEAPILYVTRQ